MRVKEKISRRIPFPAVSFERPSELGKDIAVFYDALRQHPDEEIDVRDVVINRARADEILLHLTQHEEDEVWVRGYDVC